MEISLPSSEGEEIPGKSQDPAWESDGNDDDLLISGAMRPMTMRLELEVASSRQKGRLVAF